MMKDATKTGKSQFVQIISFMGLIVLFVLVILVLSENKLESENPYMLDIEGFNKVDPKLISHDLVQKIHINCERLYGVTVDSDDILYVSADSRIMKFNPYGSELLNFDTPEPIRTIAIHEQGKIFAASATQVFVFSPQGQLDKKIIVRSDSSMITSLAVSENHLFIADAGNRIVARYDTSGIFIQNLGGRNPNLDRTGFVIPSPFFDLAIDPNKTLWVVNPGMHRFENFSYEGVLLRSWGKHSPGIDGFCGCCNPSHFARLPDGGFVTTEKGLVRVKIYDSSGVMQSVVAGPGQFELHTTGLDICVDSHSRIIIAEPASKSIKIFEEKTEVNHGG